MSLIIYAYRTIKNKQQILDLIDNDSLRNKVESLLTEYVFDMNITSNLAQMADVAGFYDQLWHLSGIKTCEDLLPHIEAGLGELKMKPDYYKQFSSSNGWGTYENFIDWLEKLIDNLKLDPKAELYVTR